METILCRQTTQILVSHNVIKCYQTSENYDMLQCNYNEIILVDTSIIIIHANTVIKSATVYIYSGGQLLLLTNSGTS